MTTPPVATQLEVTLVFVTLDTKEMELIVLISTNVMITHAMTMQRAQIMAVDSFVPARVDLMEMEHIALIETNVRLTHAM